MPSKKVLKKNLVREKRYRGYQNKKKADLAKLLKPIPAPRTKKRDFSKRPIPAPRVILNIKNPEINVPVLKPEIAVVKEKEAPTVIKKTTETVLGWMNWLAESGKKYIVKPISEKLQNLKNKINAISDPNFTVRDGPSALKEFVREKIIDGQPGFDPKSFFCCYQESCLGNSEKKYTHKSQDDFSLQNEKKNRFKNK